MRALPFGLAVCALAGCRGTAGDDSAPTSACGRTSDHASIAVQSPGLGRVECGSWSGDAGAFIALDGKLVAATAGSLSIDACSPAGACGGAAITTVQIAAPGLSLATLPVGTRVHLEAQDSTFYGCHWDVTLSGIAPPDGSAWLVPQRALLLDVHDGGPPSRGAWTLGAASIGCEIDAGGACVGGVPVGDYAIDVGPPGYSLARVLMGETLDFDLYLDAPGTWRFRNLRSFSSGICDDYWNFADWLVYVPGG